MKIASWNVNSIRARLERAIAWLSTHRPDVLCLQESKVIDDDFPIKAFEALGYQSIIHGQKSYNGVAILSLHKASDIVRGFGDGLEDPQARWVGATIAGVRVYSAYVPNGGALGSDKYQYKLAWLERLQGFLARRESAQDQIVLCGDWNIAMDDRDIHDPIRWKGEVLCTDEERLALQNILDWGLTDSFRLFQGEAGHFSWWDYRMLGFPKNKGLRIDHIYVSESMARKCTESIIDREQRKGKGASDHAPVVADFNL